MFREFDAKIDTLIAKMTLKEKIGQLNQITGPVREDQLEGIKEAIRKGEVGSLILASSSTAGNDPQGHVKIELYNELQKIAIEESRLGIPMIYGRDVIHGRFRWHPPHRLTQNCLKNAIVILRPRRLPTGFTGHFHLCWICATIPVGAGSSKDRGKTLVLERRWHGHVSRAFRAMI